MGDGGVYDITFLFNDESHKEQPFGYHMWKFFKFSMAFDKF
jgi:hypothetical protein